MIRSVPMVLLGSHDPLLELAVKKSQVWNSDVV